MWTLGGTRIYVQELSNSYTQIIPRLQPLASGTVLQFFGYEHEIKNITAIVVGSGDHDHLASLTTSGNASFELDSPEGILGNYFVKSINFNREKTSMQTIRTDLSCYAPVYRAEMQLYKDV